MTESKGILGPAQLRRFIFKFASPPFASHACHTPRTFRWTTILPQSPHLKWGPPPFWPLGASFALLADIESLISYSPKAEDQYNPYYTLAET